MLLLLLLLTMVMIDVDAHEIMPTTSIRLSPLSIVPLLGTSSFLISEHQ